MRRYESARKNRKTHRLSELESRRTHVDDLTMKPYRMTVNRRTLDALSDQYAQMVSPLGPPSHTRAN